MTSVSDTVKRASRVVHYGPTISTRPNRAKGIGFARYAMSLITCKGNRFEAAQYAKDRWGDGADDVVAKLRSPVQKTAVAAGDTSTTAWATELTTAGNLVSEFVELLRPMTLLGRIRGIRSVPFNVPVPGQSSGGTYGWVGEGKPKPVTKLATSTVKLDFTKISGIIVITEELARNSSPSAEALVRDDMLKGTAAFRDAQFVDATVAAVAGVNPAAITNGVAGTGASGTTYADAVKDLNTLLTGMAALNYPISELVLLTSESVSFALGGLENALGQKGFPLTAAGGDLRGVQVVASNSVGAQIIAMHAPSILVADDGGIEIDTSNQASIQMSDSPTDVATTPTSLWQMNLVGLRCDQFINWKKSRSDAVDRITSAVYTG